jgi:hypothetical protein
VGGSRRYDSPQRSLEKKGDARNLTTTTDGGGVTRFGRVARFNCGGGQSSMLRQPRCGGPKLEARLDVVEGGGAHSTFYRAGGEEWMGSDRR